MSHTPGPWHLLTMGGRLPIVKKIKMPYNEADTFRSTLATTDQMPGIIIAHLDFGYGKPTDEANARLIATAPELLDALQGILDIGKRDTTNPKYDGYYVAAREAVAKAKGAA
jgi:hypothetical protein